MTATPVTRLDHSQCKHPKTKAGRTACRKAMRAVEAESTPKKKAASKTKGK